VSLVDGCATIPQITLTMVAVMVVLLLLACLQCVKAAAAEAGSDGFDESPGPGCLGGGLAYGAFGTQGIPISQYGDDSQSFKAGPWVSPYALNWSSAKTKSGPCYAGSEIVYGHHATNLITVQQNWTGSMYPIQQLTNLEVIVNTTVWSGTGVGSNLVYGLSFVTDKGTHFSLGTMNGTAHLIVGTAGQRVLNYFMWHFGPTDGAVCLTSLFVCYVDINSSARMS